MCWESQFSSAMMISSPGLCRMHVSIVFSGAAAERVAALGALLAPHAFFGGYQTGAYSQMGFGVVVVRGC